jgi:site-specific recombinase XerD
MPDAPLFTRDDGKSWAHSDWDKMVRDAAKKAGLPSGVCLYTLRHSFITQTLIEGLSTLEVSKMVGISLAMIKNITGTSLRIQPASALLKSNCSERTARSTELLLVSN